MICFLIAGDIWDSFEQFLQHRSHWTSILFHFHPHLHTTGKLHYYNHSASCCVFTPFQDYCNNHSCIFQDYYLSLAEALVSSQSCNPQNHSRLVQAFHQLTPPSLNLDLSRNSKNTFRKNFEQFLPFVKGFLFYRWPSLLLLCIFTDQ